jgi:O-antigen ligase
MRLFAYVWVGLAAAVSLRRGEHLRQLAVVVGVAGAFQALYGSFEYLSGREHIFGYAKEHYLGEATGTFINRNHFAGYLAMALPLTLALIALPRRAAQWPGWRERLLTWADRRTLVRVSAFLAAFCIWTGVVLSYSRAGLVAALLGAGLMTALQWRRRWAVWLLVLALAAPTVVLLYRDLRAPGARLASLAVDVAADTGRIPVWGATAAMARDHFGLGTGFGTFDSAFPLYRPPTIHARWQHAHNDWLQSAAEGGLITTLLLAALLVVVLWPAAATGRARALLLAAAAGIAAIAFHSLSDFPLRIPAVAVLLAALAGARCATLEPPPAGPLREVTS